MYVCTSDITSQICVTSDIKESSGMYIVSANKLVFLVHILWRKFCGHVKICRQYTANCSYLQ
jgi:hypothetical protein